MDAQTWAAVLGAAGGVITVASAVGAAVGRPLRKLARDNDQFREDWYGRAARPGVAPQPGVMERLARIEGAVGDKALERKVTELERRFDDHLRSAERAQSA